MLLGFSRAWWIEPGRLLGGCYPGEPEPLAAGPKLTALLDAGVVRVLNLVEPDERPFGKPFVSYEPLLAAMAAERGAKVEVHRFPIPDLGLPEPGRMEAILAAIRAEPGVVFVHCWGGHGRTGTVAGCWLRERGLSAAAAFTAIAAARAHDAHLRGRESPETGEQRRFVELWGGM